MNIVSLCMLAFIFLLSECKHLFLYFSNYFLSFFFFLTELSVWIFCPFSSVHSVAQSCPTLLNPMDCSTPGLSVHHQIPRFTQTHVHWVGDAIQPSHPLSSPSPPAGILQESIFPSIRVFSNESGLHIRWPKDWSFSFNINPSNENTGLISFRMDWLHLLAVQGIPKGLLQHHRTKSSILQC